MDAIGLYLPPWPIDYVIADILFHLNCHHHVCIAHVPRKLNVIAHSLSYFAKKYGTNGS